MKDRQKLDNSISDSKTYCKCGHSVVMLPSTKKAMCGYCGRTIINKSKTYFRFEMLKRIKGEFK